MISAAEAKTLINDLFEEEALVIGGLVALRHLDDDLVWRLMKNLDVIRDKAIRRIDAAGEDNGDDAAAEPPNLEPHPAIENFLFNLRKA